MRVLVFAEIWGNGGVESIINNLVLYCNEKDVDVEIDILCSTKIPSIYDDTIKKTQTNFYEMNIKSNNDIKKFFEKKKYVESLIKKNHYDLVHINVGRSWTMLPFVDLKKINPDIKIVVHAHADAEEKPFKLIKTFIHNIQKKQCLKNMDYGIGCSTNALKWMFTKKDIVKKKASVIYAGIDPIKYRYSEEMRQVVRERFQIDDSTFVVGHIGRMCYQKNSIFVIQIFEEILKLNNNSKLIYIGNGEKKQEIIDYTNDHQLNDKIILIDRTSEIPGYLASMDSFVLPSIFEGLGLVLIESQMSGLMSFASNAIPVDANISSLYKSMSLSKSSKEWAEVILKNFNEDAFIDRKEFYKQYIGSIHDKDIGCEKMIKIYKEMVGEKND